MRTRWLSFPAHPVLLAGDCRKVAGSSASSVVALLPDLLAVHLSGWMHWLTSPTLAEGAPRPNGCMTEKARSPTSPPGAPGRPLAPERPQSFYASRRPRRFREQRHERRPPRRRGRHPQPTPPAPAPVRSPPAAATSGSTKAAETSAEETLARPVVRFTPPGSTPPRRRSPGHPDRRPIVMMLPGRAADLAAGYIFSTDYVHGDRRYTHYAAPSCRCSASMLFFVLSQARCR